MPEIYTSDAQRSGSGILLFLLPLPLVWVAVSALFSAQTGRLFISLAALACLWSAALLNRNGLRAEREYRRRNIATAPRTPRKTLAAILAGVGTGLTIAFLIGGPGVIEGAIGGGLATLGTLLAYGADPRGDKGNIEGSHGYSSEEIIAALDEANGKIDAIETAARGIHNTELGQRLRRITERGREILKMIESDPGDLRRARRFLNTYLDGARRVTEGYAATHTEVDSEELESNFRRVLETIETTFAEQRDKLLQDDVLDLDVQIEVLKTQLEREGVT